MTDYSQNQGDPGTRFLQRVRRAAISVLGDTAIGREVVELCDQTGVERELILQDRAVGRVIVATAGAVGQGKSWLIRQFINDQAVRNRIRSGNQQADATARLIWIGSKPPGELDREREEFLRCSTSQMFDLGVAYILVDTPGATDDDREIATNAKRALAMAAVLILVVRRDQLRSQTVSVLTKLADGTIVIPVVNCIRNKDDSQLQADADRLASRMRQSAPDAQILGPIFVPDFDVQGLKEAEVGADLLKRIKLALSPYLDGPLCDERRRKLRLAACEQQFRQALQHLLAAHLPEVTQAVARLHEETQKLPHEVALNIVGGQDALRVAIRSRLRLALLTDTPAISFPYRSLLGLLNLTHGAWDRLVLSLSGSLPSLITAAWTSARNLGRNGQLQQDLRDGLRARCDAAVSDRLGPLVHRFHDQLERISGRRIRETNPLHPVVGSEKDRQHQPHASLQGVDALQEESQRIFEDVIHNQRFGRGAAFLMAIFGMLVFWGLMSGPIMSLYGQYFAASLQTWAKPEGSLDQFPRPEFSMLFTSLLLSLLPTALFAMLVITWVQRRMKVETADQEIHRQHDEAITTLQQQGILRLSWQDERLADAEFLLTAGNQG